MPFFTSHHDPLVVALSIAIAVLASFVALDLAKRMRGDDRRLARRWWLAGSFALGTGIWSMHFIGMLAFSIPIAIGYTPGFTVLSWCAATVVSAIALALAGRDTLSWSRRAIGSVTMGTGIFAMHYIGMAAIDVAPGIVWDPALVAASLAVAVAASAAALQLFVWLRVSSGARGITYQLLAAVAMGLAICGMHYTGMAAASFRADSICFSANRLGGVVLPALVGGSVFAMLAMTLIASIYDAHMQSRTSRIAASLRVAHAALRHENDRFRVLTTLSSDWFWEDDAQSRIVTLVNSVALTAGLAREDFLGKTMRELGWSPVDREDWPRFRDLVQRRETFQELEMQRADHVGRMHFISNSGAPMFDDAGAFTGYRGVGRDITDRKRAERLDLLQHSTTRLLSDSTSVRDALPEVIRILCTNCDWQGGLFLPAPGQEPAQPSAVWAGPGEEASFARLRRLRRRRGARPLRGVGRVDRQLSCPVRAGDHLSGELEFRFRAPHSNAAMFFDAVRRIGLQLGDFIARCDVDARLRGERELLARRVGERTEELSRSNRELETARAGAEAASRAKSAFLATMSHELRTPMNGVVGMIEVLERGRLDADQADAVSTMRGSAFSLLSLIDDILEFTQADGGKMSIELAPANIVDVVEGACAALRDIALARNVDVRVTVSSSLPDRVMIDAGRLGQTLGKLLSNAIKFSGGRSVPGRVSVRVEPVTGGSPRFVLAVTDNGIGMDATTVGNLFVPFSQAEATTTRRYGGTGLGLVICKRMVDAMRGEITVTSEPGTGSTISLTLPLQAAAAGAEPSDPYRVALGASSAVALAARREPPSTAEARAANRLILVAEDDPINQKVVLQQLSLLGHAAELASDGVEALRLWREGRHGLVLSDLHMPELDGYGLARAIRGDEARSAPSRRVPILALTADATSEATDRVRDAGMDTHLIKPISLAGLGKALERWLPEHGAPFETQPARPVEPTSRNATVDVSVLRGLVGDDPDTVREFLAEFLKGARSQALEIVASCAADDSQRIGSIAHRLKSSSRSVGALALGDLCAELEREPGGSRPEIVERCRRFESAMKDVDDCIVEALGAA